MSQSKSNTTNIKVHTKHEIHVFAYNISGQLRNAVNVSFATMLTTLTRIKLTFQSSILNHVTV